MSSSKEGARGGRIRAQSDAEEILEIVAGADALTQ
jgi:hypothetical protein